MNKDESIVKKLLEEFPILDMMKFSELDIQDKLEKNPYWIVKYKDMYHKELSILEDLEMKLEKLNGLRYKWYRFEDDREWAKKEIELYCLPADKKIIQMKKIISKQKNRVRFFEMAFRGFEKQQWAMKSFIDTLKAGY